MKFKNLKLIFFISSITLAWFAKNVYFVLELTLSPHKKYILFSSLALALILASIFVIKKSRLNLFITISLYISVSFLLYADVIYERYYSAILSFDLIGQAGQIDDVMDSVITLIYPTDIWYWIDIPIIILCVLYVYKTMNVIKRRFILSLMMFLVGVISLIIITVVPLNASFSDQYKVALTGIIPSHMYNTFNVDKSIDVSNLEQPQIVEIIKKRLDEGQNKRIRSEYFGKYEGKNLIVVQAESLNTFPINLHLNNQEITPVLNDLIESSNYYPNAYLQIGRGNTSDAEFVANNSIYPMAKQGIYKTYPLNDYLSLSNVLSDSGYFTSAAHGNSATFWNRREAYQKLGFQEFYHLEHEEIKKDEIIGLGISDESMFKQMLNILNKQTKPFYSFIVTLSVHRPFEIEEEYQKLDFGKLDSTATANYLKSVNYFDTSLGIFIEGLKESGIWEDTIFVLYGDHYGLLPDKKEELEESFDISFDQKDRFNVPIIIHHPGQSEGEVNEVVTSQMDIYPTLATILGIKEPLVQFGEPLYKKKNGIAGFAYETTRYSYYSDTYDYIASHDGMFENGQCIDNATLEETKVDSCYSIYNKLKTDILLSDYLLQNNIIKDIVKE